MPDHVDTELRRLAHALVAEAPEPPEINSVPVVPLRDARRPVRRLVPAGIAAALVLVASGLVLVGSERSTDVATGASPHVPSRDAAGADIDSAPAERLILETDGTGLTVVETDDDEPSPADASSLLEVLADGSIRELPFHPPPGFAWTEHQVLPDGRVLVLGTRDMRPDVSRRDGSLVENVAFPLLLIGKDGDVQLERDVRIAGEGVVLLGATGTDAILGRGGGKEPGEQPPAAGLIVAHDLATGEERVLATSDDWRLGDIVGDRLLLAGGGQGVRPSGPAAESCSWRVVELTTDTAASWSLTSCREVRAVNASPDGRLAAVVYQVDSALPQLRLATLALLDGTVLSDELLGHPVMFCDDASTCGGLDLVDYLGMAWSDARTLRLALIELPTDPQASTLPPGESLRVETRTTP